MNRYYGLFIANFFFISTLFAEPPSLDSTLEKISSLQEKSINKSPEFKNAKELLSQKKAESYTRLTDFFPQANLQLKKQKDFFEERNAQLRAMGYLPLNSTWSIDYQWTLVNYGVIQNARKTFAENDKAVLDLTIKEKEFPINFNTHILNYLLAKYKKAAVENSLKKAETGKREAKLGFELGQKTKLDVLRSEANMVSLDSKKTSFIDEEQNAKSKLIEFSGLDNFDITFLDTLDENQILEIINSISIKNKITGNQKILPNLNQSPTLNQISNEEKINSISLASLTASQYPDLKIQGSYANSGDSINDSFHQPYRTHAVALILTIPLFNGGSLISSHFEDYHARKQIEYTTNLRKLEAENQLNNTLIKINALETLVSSLTLNVSQYEELYRLTLKSYQLGKSSLIELLEVQDNLLDSKISLAQNKIQFYTLSQNYLWQAGLQ